MDIDVHTLAALPHGQAQAELKKMELWDEHATNDGEKKEYRVNLHGYSHWTASLRVSARSEEEAGDLAIDKIETGGFDDFDYHDNEVKYAEAIAT